MEGKRDKWSEKEENSLDSLLDNILDKIRLNREHNQWDKVNPNSFTHSVLHKQSTWISHISYIHVDLQLINDFLLDIMLDKIRLNKERICITFLLRKILVLPLITTFPVRRLHPRPKSDVEYLHGILESIARIEVLMLIHKLACRA